MVQNLYTYNPYNGLLPGISLAIGVQSLHDSRKTYPPHLRCGDDFIAVERSWMQPDIVHGRLMSASVEQRAPEGKRPFKVFYRHNDASKAVYVYLIPSMPDGMKSKVDTSFLNCWRGIVTEGADVLMSDPFSGEALVALAKDGDRVRLFVNDGQVYSLLFKDGSLLVEYLSYVDMADLRIEQFESQIAGLDISEEADMRRFHGVLAGAIRLLRATAMNEGVRKIFRDFLLEHVGHMTARLRQEVRTILLSCNDLFAGNFIEGHFGGSSGGGGDMVVSLALHRAKAGRTESDRRKRERAERDRQIRDEMKGGGSGKKQKA